MPGTLIFKAEDVRRVVEHALAAPRQRVTWGDAKSPKPAVWLVGDDGVYLMSNGDPADQINAEGEPTRLFVAYAIGINPKVDNPDDVWARKREMFGGDDGVEVLRWCEALKQRLDRGDTEIRIKLTARNIELV